MVKYVFHHVVQSDVNQMQIVHQINPVSKVNVVIHVLVQFLAVTELFVDLLITELNVPAHQTLLVIREFFALKRSSLKTLNVLAMKPVDQVKSVNKIIVLKKSQLVMEIPVVRLVKFVNQEIVLLAVAVMGTVLMIRHVSTINVSILVLFKQLVDKMPTVTQSYIDRNVPVNQNTLVILMIIVNQIKSHLHQNAQTIKDVLLAKSANRENVSMDVGLMKTVLMIRLA